MESVERENKKFLKKKRKLVSRLILLVVYLVIAIIGTFLIYKVINRTIHGSNSVTSLYDKWNKYDYQSVYDISTNILQKKPLHNTARTLRGYSSFYLAVSQTDNNLALTLIDESINNIRIALQSATKKTIGQMQYMLGKAYFYKNSMSSYYYYSDLVIKYLTSALASNYKADDIAVYLGLSYASLGLTQESISSFTEALLTRESDTLLLAIAEQYYKIGTGNVSKQYLYRVNEISRNEEILIRSHILLGQIYLDENNLIEAEKEFITILEKNENSADGHYGLGVLYEKQGDLIKARSEWRKCLQIQINHKGAIQKMAENK